MIDLSRKYQQGDQFREADGSNFPVPLNWRKSTLSFLRGKGAYLYVVPTYDKTIQTIGTYVAIMQDSEQVGVTQDVTDKTSEELAADLFATRQRMILSPRQMRHALNQLGLRDQVEAAVVASGDQDTIDGWEYADTFDRLHPLVIALGVALEKTDEELDEIFDLGLSDPTFKRPEE